MGHKFHCWTQATTIHAMPEFNIYKQITFLKCPQLSLKVLLKGSASLHLVISSIVLHFCSRMHD